MWIIAGPGVPAQHREDLTICEIAPTILAQAGLLPDDAMRGRVLSVLAAAV
jgi:hypothetical protein